MKTSLPTEIAGTPPLVSNAEPMPLYDRLVLIMFLLGFLIFGLILFADLLSNFIP